MIPFQNKIEILAERVIYGTLHSKGLKSIKGRNNLFLLHINGKVSKEAYKRYRNCVTGRICGARLSYYATKFEMYKSNKTDVKESRKLLNNVIKPKKCKIQIAKGGFTLTAFGARCMHGVHRTRAAYTVHQTPCFLSAAWSRVRCLCGAARRVSATCTAFMVSKEK